MDLGATSQYFVCWAAASCLELVSRGAATPPRRQGKHPSDRHDASPLCSGEAEKQKGQK